MDVDVVKIQLVVNFVFTILLSKHALPCEVNSVTLDMAESDGNQSNQSIELPMWGNSSEIHLRLISDSENIFRLRGNRLELKRPLDRDLKDISIIRLQIRCTNITTNIQRTIPVTVRVVDVNDNPPTFLNLPYVTSISEMVAIGTTVFNSVQTTDKDSSVNSLVEYYVTPGNSSKTDGYGTFSIDFPLNGDIILKKELSYDKCHKYETIIIAVDRASEPKQRLTTTATLTVHVLEAEVTTGGPESTEVTCTKEIGDTCNGLLNNALVYSIQNDNRHANLNMEHNLSVQRNSKSINRTGDSHKVVKVPKAELQPQSQAFTGAKPQLIEKSTNQSLPMLVATSNIGFINEHSPLGSIVTINQQSSDGLQFNIINVQTESDNGPVNQNYVFELSTNRFTVNNEQFLVVADAKLDREQLDADPKIVVEAVAIRLSDKMKSLPITITVYVNNINDHTPVIKSMDPITIVSGETFVTQVRADDQDADDEISFSIFHTSDGADGKFWINRTSGVLKATTNLEPGTSYRLTVRATDRGGRVGSQTIEVQTLPAMGRTSSTASPMGRVYSTTSSLGRVAPTTSSRHIFDVQVSEAVAVGSAILSLQPGPTSVDDVTYTIMDGNADGRFALHPSTGVLTIRQPLDRESVSHYVLGLRAIDKFGLTTNTIVNVEVTDINDSNPEFVGQPYIFYVSENLVNVVIGRVRAVDSDTWINGMVHYAAPANAPISVDELTGEVRTVRALDYERQAVQHVIVSASDGATQPRIATVTVTIMVIDVPDEVPVFRRKIYDGIVPENMANVDIVQVTADDADEYKQVTYVIRSGPLNKFSVDPSTGIVRTIWPLDFEEASSYILIIGTRENQLEKQDSTCLVRITVLDRNDIPPQFTSVPASLKLKDDFESGAIIAKISAIDGDGTPPNNVIKYYLSSSNGAKNYFAIDIDSGIITLAGDLKKESFRNLQLEVKVYDMGTPQLMSTIVIPVTMDHAESIQPPISFLESIITAEIDENSLGNSVVKLLAVANKPLARAGLDTIKCEITSGNELDHFYVKRAEDANCELRTKGQKLDYESRQKYEIMVELRSSNVYIDTKRSTARITVSVKDVNDNHPMFVYNLPMHQVIGARLMASVSRDVATVTPFARVTALDQDSGSFGDVVYEILNSQTSEENYFAIDAQTGLISNTKTFETLDANVTSFNFLLMARDNPQSYTDFLNTTTNLTINLISDENRMVLVVSDGTADKVTKQKDRLMKMLQVNSKYVVNIEKIESRKYINNSKVVSDVGGTDVWLHLVDPDTLAIVRLDQKQHNKFLLDDHQQNDLLYSMSSTLEMKLESFRAPIHHEILSRPILKRADYEMDGFQAALIALAGIIAILGFVGIIYLCVIWARYVSYRDHLRRLSLAPKYEPVFFEPNLKPYETQVLHLNVNSDDNSSVESYAHFDYIRPNDEMKEAGRMMGAGHSSSSTESDSLERVTFADVMRPAKNPIYHSSDENTGSLTEETARFPSRRSISSMATTEL